MDGFEVPFDKDLLDLLNMPNSLLGVYLNKNHPYVNISLEHELGTNSTSIHEFTHMSLTNRTTFGSMHYIINNLSIFDNSLEPVKNYLIEISLKVQEAVCTFIEYAYYLKVNGIDAFQTAFKLLRSHNVKYYNYIKPLKFLFEEYDNISIDDKIVLVFHLGCISLSSKITDIPIEIFTDRKKLENFFSIQENRIKYVPDARFKTLTHLLRNALETGNVFDYLLSNFNTDIVFLEDCIDDITNYLKKCYIASNNQDAIASYLDEKFKLITPNEDYINSVVPMSFNFFDFEFINSYDGFFKICSNSKRLGTLLIAESSMEKSWYVVIYTDYEEQKNYVTLVTEYGLEELIEDCPSPLIVNSKLYSNCRCMSNSKRKLYIYLDRSYPSGKQFINDLIGLNKQARANIINYTKFYSLVTEINPTTYAIQIFLPYIIETVLTDINEGNLKLILDESLCRSQPELNDFDLIINSLFNLPKNQ